MEKMIFDEKEYTKNKVIDELIFQKLIYGIDAFTWFDNTYYDTQDIELLKSLKNEETTKKRSKNEMKKIVPKEVFQMLNKTKLTLEPIVGDALEKCCINILCQDPSLSTTIRLSCYLLYLIQLGKNVDTKLDEILYNHSDFDIYVAKGVILKYTDKKRYAEKVFDKYIYEVEYFNKLNKVKIISQKINNAK